MVQKKDDYWVMLEKENAQIRAKNVLGYKMYMNIICGTNGTGTSQCSIEKMDVTKGG